MGQLWWGIDRVTTLAMSRGVNVLLIFRRSLGENRIVGHDAEEEWSILWPNGPLTNGLLTNGHFARTTNGRPRFKIHHQFQISFILAPLLFCFQWDPLSSTSLFSRLNSAHVRLFSIMSSSQVGSSSWLWISSTFSLDEIIVLLRRKLWLQLRLQVWQRVWRATVSSPIFLWLLLKAGINNVFDRFLGLDLIVAVVWGFWFNLISWGGHAEILHMFSSCLCLDWFCSFFFHRRLFYSHPGADHPIFVLVVCNDVQLGSLRSWWNSDPVVTSVTACLWWDSFLSIIISWPTIREILFGNCLTASKLDHLWDCKSVAPSIWVRMSCFKGDSGCSSSWKYGHGCQGD